MILIKKINGRTLKELALEHYTNLVDWGILDRINTQIDKAKKHKIKEIGKKRIDFLNWLKNKEGRNLKKIITALPNELQKYKILIEKWVDEKKIEKLRQKSRGRLGSKFSDFGKLLFKEIFNYTKYTQEPSTKKWLLKNLNITTCPYCNTQKIGRYLIDNTKKDPIIKTTYDIDHYYGKALHPYLALSFYNWIPSCKTCNGPIKSVEDYNVIDYIHPYKDDFNSLLRFTYSIKNSDGFYKEEDLSISLVPNHLASKSAIEIEKAYKTATSLQLEKRYQFFKDEVFDLLKRYLTYNESIIDEFLLNYPDLFTNKYEVLKMIFCNYVRDADISKRPLAKLTKDIIEELSIY